MDYQKASNDMTSGPDDTQKPEYAQRLHTFEQRRWKQLLDVQRPYRWNIRRLQLGHTLDVGCGIGRNLVALSGAGVGIDHNPTSVQIARSRGQHAFTPEEFSKSEFVKPGEFDSLLLSHVVEHMGGAEAIALVRDYLPSVRAGGALVVITPQEAGFRTDASHMRFVGFDEIAQLCDDAGAKVERQFSFPFPRVVGRYFPYNEFVVVARLP